MPATETAARPTPESRWQRTVGPLRERDFALLWIGEMVSSFGGPFQSIAIAFFLIHQGIGPFAFGLLLATFSVSRTVGGFVAGPLADRYPRVTVLLATNVVGLVASGALFLLTLTAQAIWPLLLALVVQSLAGGAYLTAMSSVAPSVLPAEKLQSGNALIEILSQISVVVAAPLAGIVAGVLGESTAIGINTLSYLVAVAAGYAVYRGRAGTAERTRAETAGPGRRSALDGTLRSGLSGLRFVSRLPWLRLVLLVDMVASAAAAGAMVVALPFYAEELGGSHAYGILLAGFGAGSLAGMVWYGGLARRIPRRAALICTMLLAQGILLAILGLLPTGPGAVALALVGAANGVAAIAFAGLVQAYVEDRFLGRVFATASVASSVLAPVGHLLAGALIARWGTAVALAATGLAVAGTAAAGLTTRSVRSVDI